MLAVVALGVPLASTLADRVDTEVRSEARGQADLVAASANDLVDPPRRDELATLADTAARAVRGRVLIVDRDGLLLADSEGAPVGRSYRTRPEIASALRGRPQQLERSSETLGEELLATAVPVVHQGRPAGAVRITQSTDAVGRAVRRQWLGLALVGLLVVLLGVVVGWVLAGQVARPVRRLEDFNAVIPRIGASIVLPTTRPVASRTVTVYSMPFIWATARDGCERATFTCVVPSPTVVVNVRWSVAPATASRGAS